MKLRISLAVGGRGDLESLQDWLSGENELAGRVRGIGPAPRAGELGSLTDALIVAVGSGGTLSVLAASLKAWLSLPRRSDVRIRIHHADGNSVEIDALQVNAGEIDIQAMIRQALGSGVIVPGSVPGSPVGGQPPLLDSGTGRE